MFDKENVEKENEQFSSSILYVATGVYVGICAMVFGALYAKLPTFGEAFLVLMKDYGTILAGMPVLVAVVVAKQQLDANRRQHIATVKRSLKVELDLLDQTDLIANFLKKQDISSLKQISRSMESNHAKFVKRREKFNERAEGILPITLIDKRESVLEKIHSFNKEAKGNTSPDNHNMTERYESIIRELEELGAGVKKYRIDLSQYWS